MEETRFQKEFNRLAQDYVGEETALIMGCVDSEMPHVPQLGVVGDMFSALVVIAAAIRKLASHVDDTPENILGTIYEMIVEVQSMEKDEVKQ